MKHILMAALLGSTALTGAALAQEAAAPDAAQPSEPEVRTETVPVTTEPAAQADTATAAQGGFVTYQAEDQMIASNLMGASVRGAEGEVIGAVDDLLLDRDGRIMAVVVGVGGFLGIGERDVAISAERLDFVLAQDAAATGGTMAEGNAPEARETAATGMGNADAGATVDADAVEIVEGAEETVDAAGTTARDLIEADPTDPGGSAPALDAGEGVVIPSGETVRMNADGTSAGDMDGTAGMTTADAGAAGARLGWTGQVIDHIQVDFTREQLETAPAFETIE